MLTDAFYATIAAQLASGGASVCGLYLAVGRGDPSWDRRPPLVLRSIARLENELARKRVKAEHLTFLDAAGTESSSPTSTLRISLYFDKDEANGTLRELGLFSAANDERDSGTLLSHFAHAPIPKGADMNLQRILHIDFTPHAQGAQPTRFLGNSHSREVHDTANPNAACRIEAIRFDRRIYFAGADQAVELGYDLCAFCFGRAQSRR